MTVPPQFKSVTYCRSLCGAFFARSQPYPVLVLSLGRFSYSKKFDLLEQEYEYEHEYEWEWEWEYEWGELIKHCDFATRSR